MHGEIKPAGKLELIERLQKEGHVWPWLAMVSTTPRALAKADVGIAMGSGTDVAMNSAQVTLVKGDLRGIVAARKLSVQTVGNMRQNLLFALFYNALGIPLAAGLLYPLTGLVSVSDVRRARHEPEFRFGGRQRLALEVEQGLIALAAALQGAAKILRDTLRASGSRPLPGFCCRVSMGIQAIVRPIGNVSGRLSRRSAEDGVPAGAARRDGWVRMTANESEERMTRMHETS